MITTGFAREFAEEWIASWNAQDLDRVLSYYSDDFEMTSPIIVHLKGETDGRLKGREAVAEYLQRALHVLQGLHLKLETILTGVDSVTLYYTGPRGYSAEVFHFDENRKIVRTFSHFDVG